MLSKYYRHRKRGTVYKVIHEGTFQSTFKFLDNDPVVIYQCMMTDNIYVRELGEFLDGRFEQVEM